MDLLTPEHRAKLIANAAAHTQAMQRGLPEPDPAPVVKFFNPCGAATWLFSELDSDGDTLFGLCDLGFGSPELGSASLAEIASVTVALGLKIERDLHFTATFPLSAYAEAARQHGGIVENDAALAEAATRLARERKPLAPSIPTDGDKSPRTGNPSAGVPGPASTAPQDAAPSAWDGAGPPSKME
ncbi:MAG: DUF2958 domain-containing protein [Novosphingobium sp.]|uniref:DUF2958 domain-containing protein n=1 Tax=Novosphingobium sp. TaxID=1874826 RepID=UPI0032B7E590